MASEQKPTELFSIFIQLEREVRHAKNKAEFAFTVCNSTKQLINYHQAIFWYIDITGQITINAISGTAQLNQNAPFLIWLRKSIKTLEKNKKVIQITPTNLPQNLKKEWSEWMPPNSLWCPFLSPSGELIGGLWLNRQPEFTSQEQTILERLTDAYAHAWYALIAKQKRYFGQAKKTRLKKVAGISLIVFILILLIPIRQSVLAPAEIVAKNPIVVSSPLEGVIKSVDVDPNQTIQKGQLLFNLDPTDFVSRYKIAQNNLIVAREKYRKAAQHAFNNPESKGQLAILKAEIEKSKTELAYIKELLEKINVKAPNNGITIFSDKNDWLGKPVTTGERVMLIANPNKKELNISLPIEDAITLKPGSKVRVFLNVDPLHPINAKLRYASYSAVPKPDGTLIYRLKATFPNNAKVPRIGLRGTAKVYGKRVILVYYLMWRPISALRRALGL